MTRRILFYLPRNNDLRVFAPIIAHLLEAAAGRVRLRVAMPAWPVGKTDLQPAPADLSAFGEAVDCTLLEDRGQLESLFDDADVFVTYLPRMTEFSDEDVSRLRERSRTSGVVWVAVPYLFSQDHYPLLNPRHVLRTWDVICTVGQASIRYVEEATRPWAPALRRSLLDRLVVTGYPALDGLRYVAEPAAVRRRHALPADAPIICLATAPRFYPRISATRCARGLQARFRGDTDWTPGGLAGHIASTRYPWVVGYREYLTALRTLADAHGAVILAKTRAKHDDPPYLRDFVDHVVGDDSFFPTTALEIMTVSTLYFGFYSAMAVEALAARVFALTAIFQPPEVVENPEWKGSTAHFYHRPGALWDVPDVSEAIDGVGRRGRAAVRALERFELGRRPDESRRLAFLADYFNWPCHASARAADVLLSAGRVAA